jgi:hypothetical protein
MGESRKSRAIWARSGPADGDSCALFKEDSSQSNPHAKGNSTRKGEKTTGKAEGRDAGLSGRSESGWMTEGCEFVCLREAEIIGNGTEV